MTYQQFETVVEDAKRHFGQWDICDPVVWALLGVVQAQNDLAAAIDEYAKYPHAETQVEQAIEKRVKAIIGLQTAIEEEPRAFQ